MKKYQFITFALIALALIAALPAEANESRNLRAQFPTEKKEELKAKFIEKRKEVIERKIDNVYGVLEKKVTRLDLISQKIESRITKIESETDRDLSDAKTKLGETKTKISETKTIISDNKKNLEASLLNSSEIKYLDIRESVTKIVENIKSIKNSLWEIIKMIK